MLFTDDAALATQAEADLQKVMGRFSHDCNVFELTTSTKKMYLGLMLHAQACTLAHAGGEILCALFWSSTK